MQKDSSILLLVSYTTLPQCSEFSLVKLKVMGLVLLFFFSLCGYLKRMYSVLCYYSVSSFQRHYIMWRILSLNLHKIFVLLCGVILLLYQTFFWYNKLRNQCLTYASKKHMRTLCDLGLFALSAKLFQFVFLQKPPGFLQQVMVFPAEKQFTGLSSEKYFRYYDLVFSLPDFLKNLQKCYLEL